MKLEMKDRIIKEHSNVIRHPGTVWLAFLHTLLLACFMTEVMAEGSSRQSLVSYAFDDEVKHLVVASCFEGLGKMLVFDAMR
jgi:hypothetical protein